MSIIVTPYIFQAGTTIASAQVNANFAAINAVVNGNLDGSNFSTIFEQVNLNTPGSATFPGGLILNWGSSTVAADNTSATAVTFDTTYTNSVFAVVLGVGLNTTTTPQAVSAYHNAVVQGTMNLTALGGATGTTVKVDWLAVGF